MLSSTQFLFRSGTCTYFWMLLLAPACALHTVELGEAASSGKATRTNRAARRKTQAKVPFNFGPCFLVWSLWSGLARKDNSRREPIQPESCLASCISPRVCVYVRVCVNAAVSSQEPIDLPPDKQVKTPCGDGAGRGCGAGTRSNVLGAR